LTDGNLWVAVMVTVFLYLITIIIVLIFLAFYVEHVIGRRVKAVLLNIERFFTYIEVSIVSGSSWH
jgi:hypothetical protein